MYLTKITLPFLLLLLPYPVSSKSFQADSAVTVIHLSTEIDRTETPMNVPVFLTVILSWEGKPDRYIIGTFENPVLANLEIIGSQSTTRTEVRAGKVFTIKEFTYTLQPIELGMGYIDAMNIEYTDNMAGTKDHLLTQRMSIKGLPPVYETGFNFVVMAAWLLLLAGMLIGLFLVVRRRKNVRKPLEIQRAPIEDSVVERMKTVHAQNNLTFRQKLDEVVTDFRNFLLQKFKIPDDCKTDELIVKTIRGADVDEEIIAQVQTIFERAEQLRFSGKEVKDDDFELLYGAVESCVASCGTVDSNQ